MLKRLIIKNYAIIDDLEIEFSTGMNAITGETGAGKSIIMGALGLILGNRSDSTALLQKDVKCVIEGIFSSEQKSMISEFLAANDLDAGNEIFIRREITPQGKSRAFINDTPVNLSQLQQLSSLLVDLHQQFDTLSLGETGFQREVLDAMAGHQHLVTQYAALFSEWQNIQTELKLLVEQKSQFEKEADYNRYLFTELEEAAFKPDELESIDADLRVMNSAEEIKAVLGQACTMLNDGDEPVVQQLKKLVNQLQAFTAMNTALGEQVQRLHSAQIEIQDIASELENLSAQVHYDANKIELLNERLTLGYKLQKKHGVQSTNELIALQHELDSKLQAVLNIDDAITQKEKAAKQLQNRLQDAAAKISEGRKLQAPSLETAVNKLLKQVGMPNARLKINIHATTLNAWGSDNVEFLFNANIAAGDDGKDKHFLPLMKVASGGELSRLMLCIKSLVARSIDLPTLIFDEIDTGISGEAARQVGIIMKELATQRQLICITHQPQIAGKATAHYFVFKTLHNKGIATRVRLLSTEERIEAIAKMLGGETPSAAALENAREMVSL